MPAAFDLPAEQWSRLRELLDEAMALAPAARAAWLDRLSGDDTALRPRLSSLLTASDAALPPTLPKVETADFAPLPRAPGAPGTPDAPAAAAPERIGPYRLLKELGSGGMASVWLAERTDMLQARHAAA
jgi:eukaryotic-like serine/threonine-protein kinase